MLVGAGIAFLWLIMKDLITITAEDKNGSIRSIELPTDMGLNLMEALKGDGYDIEATCGGMALCATCHVRVIKGLENLLPQGNDELDMLDTLPIIFPDSRLSCQIHITEAIDGLEVKVVGA